MMSSISWQEIRGPGMLAELEPEWSGLWQRSPSATPFQAPAWLLPWWRAFAPGDVFSLAAWQGSRLVALAPTYLERGPLGHRLLPIGVSLSDYQDILVDAEAGDTVCGSLVQRMADFAPAWDAWEITELAPGAWALNLLAPATCEQSVTRSSACPVLSFPAGAESLDDVLACRRRRAMRGARNRAARRGRVEIAAAETHTALPMLETLIRLHRARWQGRGETGIMADPRVQQFHREAVPRLLANGMLQLFELRIAEAPAGIYYGLRHRDRAYGYIIGFDPAYEFESPGVILLAHAIEHAIRDGAREFHFLRGQERYKYNWGAEDRWNQCRIFRRTPAYAQAS
jgi:CelD/BcsL family acetyltransferase involved in cellulose biosynthesis